MYKLLAASLLQKESKLMLIELPFSVNAFLFYGKRFPCIFGCVKKSHLMSSVSTQRLDLCGSKLHGR